MQQNQDRALAQQAALAASARGGNLGVAQRAAQENIAMMSPQNVAEAQKAKLAEMQQAQSNHLYILIRTMVVSP
jgi:hypothetical protein